MAGSGKRQVTDVFQESLSRLTERQGPLQQALEQLRASLETADWSPPSSVEENLRQVDRDLSAIQIGSRRIVKKLEGVQGLVHTSALITSSLEIDRVLEEVMDTAITLTNAERAFLMLCSEDGELELRAARNWDRESLDEYEVTFSRSIIDTAMETGEPVLTINAQGDTRFQAHQSVLVNELRSIICIPLKLREDVIGVLYADNRFEQGVFDDDSVELVSTFANHAAIAIDNARHFERVRADLAKAEHEVWRLQIEINEQRLKSELSEVTDTDYFQRLSSLARDLRRRKGGE
ncbi:MAG: GAF domain-containing protein [Trueperaceae bacterium]